VNTPKGAYFIKRIAELQLQGVSHSLRTMTTKETKRNPTHQTQNDTTEVLRKKKKLEEYTHKSPKR